MASFMKGRIGHRKTGRRNRPSAEDSVHQFQSPPGFLAAGVAEGDGPVANGPPDRLEIDVKGRELRVNGSAVPISGRAFAVLQTLVEASGIMIESKRSIR